jgi:hypothetical protein
MSTTSRERTPFPVPYIRVQPDHMPTVAEVETLDKAAGKIVNTMHTLLTEARTAAGNVTDSRYRGPIWDQAETQDRHAVMNGETPTALATLIHAEPERYALCVALTGSLEARLAAARDSGKAAFTKAITAAKQQQTQLLDDATALTEQGWPQRDTGRGQVALEDAEQLVDQAHRLECLIRWLDGTDRKIDRNASHFVPLDPVARGRLTAYGHDRRGSAPMLWPEASSGVLPRDWTPSANVSITAP